jgi:hypothetical protein
MAALSILLVSAEIFVIVGFVGKCILGIFRDKKKKVDRLSIPVKG